MEDEGLPPDWKNLLVTGEELPPYCTICGDEGVVTICCGNPGRGWGCSGECAVEVQCACAV